MSLACLLLCPLQTHFCRVTSIEREREKEREKERIQLEELATERLRKGEEVRLADAPPQPRGICMEQCFRSNRL